MLTDKQQEKLRKHFEECNALLHDIESIPYDTWTLETAGQLAARMRGKCNELNLHLFRTFGMLHSFSQQNYFTPELSVSTSKRHFTVNDL